MPRSKVCSLQILIVINSRGEKGYSGDLLPGEGLFWDAPPGQITYHFRPEKNGKQKPHYETTVESLERLRIFKYTKRSFLFKRKLWASLFLSQLASKNRYSSQKKRVFILSSVCYNYARQLTSQLGNKCYLIYILLRVHLSHYYCRPSRVTGTGF